MLGPEIENLIYIIIPGTVFVFLISVYLIFQKGPSKTKEKDDAVNTKTIGADYHLIVKQILKLPAKNKSIIFIAPGIESLPTTIPVNVAIQLSKNKKRCFLIDLDLKRNAIAKAFDIQPSPDTSQPTAQQTPFKHLYIWPAHNFTQIQKINIAPLVATAISKFEYVLVNAPYLITNQTWKQIIETSQYCLLFSHDTEQAQPILDLIEQTECKLIANIQLP